MKLTTSRAASAALLTGLLFVGAGCISVNSGTSGPNPNSDGGVLKTANKGDLWTQKSAVATTGTEKRSISGVNVITIVQDPSDPAALYIGTTDNGLLYTYDGGESWEQPGQVSRGRIPSIAVDPKNKCIVYAAAENKLLKTVDCSRTWTTTYVDTRREKATTAVIVDFYDPRIVWIGNSSGDVLKSTDAGATWVPVKSFERPIAELAMSASDSRKVYAATKDDGVWRTDDAGANWKNLRENYKDFSGGSEFMDMSLGVSDPAVVVLATKYGLLRSTDGGDKWSSIELLTPPNEALIYSVVVDPKDVNGLYYGTANTFYRSPNAGVNWVPKQLITSRAATALLVDRSNQNVIYMGVTRFK